MENEWAKLDLSRFSDVQIRQIRQGIESWNGHDDTLHIIPGKDLKYKCREAALIGAIGGLGIFGLGIIGLTRLARRLPRFLLKMLF